MSRSTDELADRASVPASRGTAFLVHRGADTVLIAEDLYVRFFVLTLGLLIAGSAWSVWARVEDAQRGDFLLTVVFAALGVAAAAIGLRAPRRAYAWLRYSRWRQSLPGAAAVAMMLADGPHSATWWMAFALLFVMASLSSTSLSLLAATCAAGAYIGGTVLYGSVLVYRGDTGNLVGAAMLIVDVLAARAVAESFGSFVLRLHRLEAVVAETQRSPVRVRNLTEPSADADRTPAAAQRSAPIANVVHRARSRLTARQLEVALLVRDGLHNDEIARCLSISRRQVERLMEQARARVGAATTNELVAMLVAGRLAPATEDRYQ